ncbi:MAG: LysR family transcriptional regulator [Cyanobacteria bacterium P01_D01_bin.115]
MTQRHSPGQPINLANVDLNLLVAFDALLTQGSVSEAAIYLGLTQPAMSKRLARLRKVFHDDVFVRTSDGMRLTARSLDLAEPIQTALRQVEIALGSHLTFQPSASTRTFRIATTDLTIAVLIPSLIAHLQGIAPGMSLILLTLHRGELVEALTSGKIDLAITVLPDAPSTIKRLPLFEERFVCLVAVNHPEIQGSITLEQYVTFPHILVTYTADLTGVVDRILEEQGLKRQVVASFPHHLAAPAVVAKTHCIVTVAARAARCYEGTGVQILPLPIDLAPYQETMLWHRRDDLDRTHQWLRAEISELAADMI